MILSMQAVLVAGLCGGGSCQHMFDVEIVSDDRIGVEWLEISEATEACNDCFPTSNADMEGDVASFSAGHVFLHFLLTAHWVIHGHSQINKLDTA